MMTGLKKMKRWKLILIYVILVANEQKYSQTLCASI